jgi:ribosomal 50S subunit-recycling heat shock protein
MRLDKFLKVSRLIKRRTLAKDAAESEKIMVNGKIAKPSKELQIGDIITIEFGNKIVNVKVASFEVSTKKADASNLYEFVSEEKKDI